MKQINKQKNKNAMQGVGENSAVDAADKGLISQIYKRLITLNIKKKQRTQLKNGQKT